MRALIVDDSRVMRMVLGRQLSSLGFDIVEAGDGQEGLDVLETLAGDPPVLATVDWNMPVMDGLTFIQRVRRQPHLREMTLLMVTTESEYDQIVRALAAGAHEYLIKPFQPEALADKLDMLGLLAPRTLV